METVHTRRGLFVELTFSIPPNHPTGARFDPFGPVGPDFGTNEYVLTF
jgi:hypothetical protein